MRGCFVAGGRVPQVLLVAAVAAVAGGCPGGRDQLIADLQSNRPDVRVLAVKRLAERYQDDDLGLFTQAARDPVASVRAEAMAALAHSQDLRVVDLLVDSLGDSDETVQAKAARSLASIRSDKARNYLTLQYGRRGRSTRATIVKALKGANVPGAMAAAVAAEASSIWDRNLKALTGGALPERVGAAEELGRSGRPEAVNRLVPLLSDNQIVLAAAAARGLGYAGDPRAVAPLTALLEENFPELREASCEALANLQDPAALSKLAVVAQEHNSGSLLAVSALVALPRTPETDRVLCELTMHGVSADSAAAGREMRRRGGCPLEPILEKLRSGSGAVGALAAVVALGPTASGAGTKIVPLLGSSDANLRKLAADALTEVAEPATAAALIKAFDAELKALEPQRLDWVPAELPSKYGSGFDPSQPPLPNDPASVVRLNGQAPRTARVLHERHSQEQGKVLIQVKAPREVVDDATDEQLKVLASLVRAIGKLKVDGARERVEPFTREGSASLRSAAFSALAMLGGDGVERATVGLYDSERSVQAATAQALADSPIGQAAVLEAIKKLPGDRTRLLEALKGQPLVSSAVTGLLDLLKEGGAEAGLAALLLADLRSREAVEPLIGLLDDPHTVARREVLTVLGRLGDARAAEAIGQDLYSDRPDIRTAAVEALAAVGGGSHKEALDALRGDYYFRVREAATAAQKRLGDSSPTAEEKR